MDNGIIKRENENENIQKLAAQRQIYSKAKSVFGVEIITQVIIIIILSLLPIIFNDSFLKVDDIGKENLKSFTVICSLILVLLDVIIMNPQIDELKYLAASIQQDFDCTVLLLPWNDIKISKPDLEIISRYARRYYKDNKSQDLENWYTPNEIETLPIAVARIICQRTNCTWDNYLRKNFTRNIEICTLLLFIFLLSVGLIHGISLQKFMVYVFCPFLPALTFSIIQVQNNNSSIKSLERLKNIADEYWEKILSNTCDDSLLYDLSKKLQNEIFDNRKNSPLIFDWYYKKFRSSQQSDTDYTGEVMVKTYNSKK